MGAGALGVGFVGRVGGDVEAPDCVFGVVLPFSLVVAVDGAVADEFAEAADFVVGRAGEAVESVLLDEEVVLMGNRGLVCQSRGGEWISAVVILLDLS